MQNDYVNGKLLLLNCVDFFYGTVQKEMFCATLLANSRNYCISVNSFPRKLFFFEFNLMYSDLCPQYIQVRKLFKGGNHSRAETIRGNTVYECNKLQLKTSQFNFTLTGNLSLKAHDSSRRGIQNPNF